MQTSKCASLAGILLSEWRSALVYEESWSSTRGHTMATLPGWISRFCPQPSCCDQNAGSIL